MTDFKVHPWQQAFMENPRRFFSLQGGQRGGRRAAAIAEIRALAADEHEAEMAIADLEERGAALLREGKRYEPPPRPGPRIVFDEVSSVQSQ